MKQHEALALVLGELEGAIAEHGPMASCHEGWAVIREEVDELWDAVKADDGATHRGASEAVQVAAMGLRYLIDLCDAKAAKEHATKVEAWRSQSEFRGGYSG